MFLTYNYSFHKERIAEIIISYVNKNSIFFKHEYGFIVRFKSVALILFDQINKGFNFTPFMSEVFISTHEKASCAA